MKKFGMFNYGIHSEKADRQFRVHLNLNLKRTYAHVT